MAITSTHLDSEPTDLTWPIGFTIEPIEVVMNPMPWGLTGLDMQQMAAAGYFQAIAYWLNEPLVPQNVYAQVLADEVPGRLKILVEFERPPQAKRLIRLVCDRLYQLNSDVIEGIHLVARSVGAAKTDWEQSIRIPTATQRLQKQAAVPAAVPAAQAIAEPAPPEKPAPQLVHESSRSQVARQVVRSQFKFFRAALISGATAAAFLFGGFTELILSGRLSSPVVSEVEETVDPWYAETTEDSFPPAESDQATTVAFRPASRFSGRTVEAALETVAVIPHNLANPPYSPTVTLLFGGELSLDNFTFEQADDLDQLFSDVHIYQQADVAMVGLAEPLANASTSLQEDFYRRTRPQAVQMLKAGGIDLVSLASEGSMIYGSRGLDETLETLDRQGIYRVGAGRDVREAHRPEILEVKGQRIAYLGYNPDALKGAKAEKAGVASANSEDRQHIIDDIRAIRPQVDWIVVNYRWGDTLAALGEEQDLIETTAESALAAAVPEDWQKSLAHEAVDAGADLVVGYHPDRIQGAEIYRNRAIAYSLGDFVFDGTPLKDHDTAALKVSLRNYQMKVEFLPVTIRDSKLQMATGEDGADILKTIRDASKTFQQPMQFPTVLEARPPRLPPLPQPADTDPAAQAAPSQPDTGSPSQAASAPVENWWLEENDSVAPPPASSPIRQESERLFRPSTGDASTGQNEAAIVEGDLPQSDWQEPLQNQDLSTQWGQKPATSGHEFSPIPAGALHRESPSESEGALEESYPDSNQSDVELYFEPEDEPLDVPDSGLAEVETAEPETSALELPEDARSEDARSEDARSEDVSEYIAPAPGLVE